MDPARIASLLTPFLAPESLTDRQLAQVSTYLDLLLKWNARVNLTSVRRPDQIVTRHFGESFFTARRLCHPAPGGLQLIDLGSGAGFPGLVLAIATGIPFDLIESDHRKAAFLREAARATGAPATIHASRIEATDLPPAPLVTARALAPLPELLGLAAPKLAPNGFCLFLKGENAASELTAAATQWHMRIEQFPSRTHPSGCILRLSEIARAPNGPRDTKAAPRPSSA
jgi:16S rRNA (guanine527-N7)-methyltransferase